MTPTEPREDGRERVTFAKEQAEYLPLPATVGPAPQVEVTTEWELSAEELQAVLEGGRVQLKTWTFGLGLQPVLLSVVPRPGEGG